MKLTKDSPENPTEADPRTWLREVKTNLTLLVQSILQRPDNHDEEEGDFDPEQCSELLLQDAMRSNASDIHLDPQTDGVRIRLRIDGSMHDSVLLTHDQGTRLMRYLKTMAGLNPVAPFRPEEGAIHRESNGRPIELRLATTPTASTEKMTIRLHDPDRASRSLVELGLSQTDLALTTRWLSEINGMCLVAGPTGAGKTTTVYSLLHQLKKRNKSIVTIEDPVEYHIDGITQTQVDPRHGLNFETGLRAVLRLDPDYLVLGEMRDTASCETAVRAAALGHVLMSTLHARDAAGVVTALRSWGIEDHRIAANLELTIAQRLVRKLCEHCRVQRDIEDIDKRWLDSFDYTPMRKAWTAPGCRHCHGTGHHGRIGVFEIWRRTDADAEAILGGAAESQLRHNIRQQGCRSLIEDGLEKAGQGVTSLSDIRALGEPSSFVKSVRAPRGRVKAAGAKPKTAAPAKAKARRRPAKTARRRVNQSA